MKTEELRKLERFLERVGPKDNPFRDECLAFVRRDIAIREQQSDAMRQMNRDAQADASEGWPFYGQ